MSACICALFSGRFNLLFAHPPQKESRTPDPRQLIIMKLEASQQYPQETSENPQRTPGPPGKTQRTITARAHFNRNEFPIISVALAQTKLKPGNHARTRPKPGPHKAPAKRKPGPNNAPARPKPSPQPGPNQAHTRPKLGPNQAQTRP